MKFDGFEPELRPLVLATDVYVRRLVVLQTIEEEYLGADP